MTRRETGRCGKRSEPVAHLKIVRVRRLRRRIADSLLRLTPMSCRDRFCSLCDARSLTALFDGFAAGGFFGPGSIGAGPHRRGSCKWRPQQAAVPRPTARALRTECGRAFNGGDKTRRRRDLDSVWANKGLDEAPAACVIAASADGGFELRRVFLHRVRDVEDAAVDVD